MTDATSDDLTFRGLLGQYGVTDEDSGHNAAAEARQHVLSVGRTLIPSGPLKMDHLLIAGVVARAHALHEASISAIDSNNPHAAFTVLRAYAEQCAAVLYMKDHPAQAERFWNDPEGHGVPVGRIKNYAQRSGRLPNFGALYDQLSAYAHPSASALFASMRVGEDDSLSWQTVPRFKHDDDKLMAYVWCIELAQAFNLFSFELAVARGLGSFVPASDVDAPPTAPPATPKATEEG